MPSIWPCYDQTVQLSSYRHLRISDEMSSSSNSRPDNLRTRILSYAKIISHGTAPFITTFLLIHLTAPALANVGGSSLASQTMVSTSEHDVLLVSTF